MRFKGFIFVGVLFLVVIAGVLISGMMAGAVLESRSTLAETQALRANTQALQNVARAQHLLEATLHPQLRQWLQGYNSQLSNSQLASLAQQMQSLANAQLCNLQGIRIFFTSMACGQPLPSNQTLAQGGLYLQDGSQRLPFLILAQAQEQASQRSHWQRGEFRIRIGNIPFTHYALLMGGPAPLLEQGLWDGPVWVGSNPQFRANPYFAASFSSSNPTTHITFGPQQAPSQRLNPSNSSPCYPEACPIFAGGNDWQANPPQWPAHNPLRALAQQGGLLLSGDFSLVQLSSTAQQTHITLCQTRCNTFRLSRQDNGFKLEGPTIINPFNGVIYLEGGIARLTATQPAYGPLPLTLAARDSITLTSNLLASNNPCPQIAQRNGSSLTAAICNPQPLLGLYSHQGDIWLQSTTPITLHASLLLPRGQLQWQGIPQALVMVGSLASARTSVIPTTLTHPNWLSTNPPPGFPTLLVQEVVVVMD